MGLFWRRADDPREDATRKEFYDDWARMIVGFRYFEATFAFILLVAGLLLIRIANSPIGLFVLWPVGFMVRSIWQSYGEVDRVYKLWGEMSGLLAAAEAARVAREKVEEALRG